MHQAAVNGKLEGSGHTSVFSTERKHMVTLRYVDTYPLSVLLC